ncbi:hypothetical protein ACVXG7_01970 [Enterobacter hormaechei]
MMKIGAIRSHRQQQLAYLDHCPAIHAAFELNKAIVQKAEHYHFDFALSMIKLRGFGGKTEFSDHDEVFTRRRAWRR